MIALHCLLSVTQISFHGGRYHREATKQCFINSPTSFFSRNQCIMKKYSKTFLLVSLCLSPFYLFSQQTVDTAKANNEVLAALNDYIAALNKLDLTKTISYFSNTKDFLVFDNGKAWNYEEFTDGLRSSFSQIKKALVRHDTVYVRSIAGGFDDGALPPNSNKL